MMNRTGVIVESQDSPLFVSRQTDRLLKLRIGSAVSMPTASRFDALRLLKALSMSKGASPFASAD
jgi:hypothetical protein